MQSLILEHHMTETAENRRAQQADRDIPEQRQDRIFRLLDQRPAGSSRRSEHDIASVHLGAPLSTSRDGGSAMPDIDAEIELARLRSEARRGLRHISKLRNQIKARLAKGDIGRARQLQDLILKSAGGKLWVTLEAERKLRKNSRKRGEPKRPLAPATLREIARNLDLYAPSGEEVRIFPESKRSGGYRLVCSFGVGNRARQELAKFAFQPFSVSGDTHYGSAHEAVGAVSAALSSWSKWVVRVDIKDCFPSLDAEERAALIPLPHRVTSNVIAEPPRTVRVRATRGETTLLSPSSPILWSRLGLPQGSASSPCIAHHLLATALRRLPNIGQAVFYADDGLILARTRREAELMKDALHDAFSERGLAGRLEFKHCEVRRASYGFEFLGYHIRRQNGRAVCRPADGKTAGVRELVSRWLLLNHGHQRLREKVIGWWAAHRHWENASGFRDHILNRIDDAERLGYDPNPPYPLRHLAASVMRMSRLQPEEQIAQFRKILTSPLPLANHILKPL